MDKRVGWTGFHSPLEWELAGDLPDLEHSPKHLAAFQILHTLSSTRYTRFPLTGIG